jgi:tetratricopeptide (TPR) repeat protein
VRVLHGDFSAALNAYDTALENGLSARHAGYFNRGLVLEHMGRWDDAEAAYAEAAALAPDWRLPGEHIERVRQRRAAAAAQSQ